MSKNAEALAFKAAGNTFFKEKSYAAAIEQYDKAIACDCNDVTFFSNRSACHAALGNWQNAADDGRQCIMIDKKFVKGYFRAGLAQQSMKNWDQAMDVVKRGLGVDSKNADLKKMSTEINEAIRKSKVDSAITTTNDQIGSGDIYGAFRTLEAALRLDPDNDRLNKLMGEVKPMYEKKEKQRVSSLDPLESIKEGGDKYYKESNFEKAIEKYTQAIDKHTNKGAELALKCYANRAACFKQLSNFDGTIGDCTQVLEYKPDDVKSLIRRAQAYEACERFKLSLQDVRQVLSYGLDTVGKTNFDLANGMQHRLNKVIAMLKAQN